MIVRYRYKILQLANLINLLVHYIMQKVQS